MANFNWLIKQVWMVIFCFFSLSAFSQINTEVKNDFKKYQDILTEKIFVHTDRNSYVVGELVWFKIYNVDATNKANSVSKVAYLEIVDKDNNPVLQAKVALKSGLGNGSLLLPASLISGNYKLRCYTSWMKNFESDFYFEKTIAILNPLNAPVLSLKNAPKTYDIQFFPEGGTLVNSLASKVAFRVVNSSGMGVDFNGSVLDKNNQVITTFKPLKAGIGNFIFAPAKDNFYKASVEVDGKIITKALPAAVDYGFVLQVTEESNNKIKISVQSPGQNDHADLLFFAHAGQKISVSQNISVNYGKGELIIDQDNLSDGISHFTIFNINKQPICERLFFKKPVNELAVTANSNSSFYRTRTKANLSIAANLETSELANLSLSVFKVDSIDNVNSFNIKSYLLLSSDLKGNIEDPDSYFENKSISPDAFDNLMLTHGWSKFNWSSLSKTATSFKYIPDYSGLVIKGRIIDSVANSPKQNIQTYLSVPGKQVRLNTFQSDANGNIYFSPKNFYGLNELVVQANSEKDSAYKIELSNPFSDAFSKKQLPEINTSLISLDQLRARSIGMQTQSVFFGSKTKTFQIPEIDSSSFYDGVINRYMLDDYTRFSTMEEVLREYVSEVVVNKTNRKYHFKVYVPSEKILFDDNPLALLDGVPVFDMDKVIKTDPLKINYLDVVPYRYYLGSLSSDGIVSLRSYNGDMGNNSADRHALIVDYEGLQLKREFFAPVYEVEAQKNSRIPDFRNLLYWNPNITLKNKTDLSFYTSDEKGKYLGVVQGITSTGNIASTTFTFEVKEDDL